MRDLWVYLTLAVFIIFSHLAWGIAGVLSALLLSVVLLFAVSSPNRAGAVVYFFLGFLAGFVVAVGVAYYTNPHGAESALLLALPFLGSAVALWYGKGRNYALGPLFRYGV